MREVLLGEWTKAWSGRAWAVLVSIAVSMFLLSGLGYAVQGDKLIDAGRTDIAAVTNDVVRSSMTTFLFASLFGALLVTREYSSGSISRSVLLTGGRDSLFLGKLMVGAAVGALFGLVAVLLAAVSSWGMLACYGHSSEWTSETSLIALGVFACNVLAAPWGVFIGWIIRHQIGAVGTLMALSLLVDPALQRLVPDASKYLLTIAMSSVYRDEATDLLSPQIALLVIAGWIGAAGFAAHKLLHSRDIT